MSSRRLALALATWAGVGYSPVAPGTVGSIAAAFVAWLALDATSWPSWSLAVLAMALLGPAVWSAHVAEQTSGREDPGFIVVDEVVGQWLALALIDPARWSDWIAAVALFRVFDIVKPPPLRRLEKLPNGWGVIADDAAAGLYAMMTFALVRSLAGIL